MKRIFVKYKLWRYCLIVLLLLAVFFYWQWANGWKSRTYTIASGQQGGGYHEVAEALKQVSKKHDVKLQLRELETDGSVANTQLVAQRKADFGLIQSGGMIDEHLRVVTHVYDDIVHILKRNDSPANTISDLAGKKIAYGLKGSGTRLVAMQILQHYGLSKDSVREINTSPKKSIEQLLSGEIDAVILVTAAQAPVIRQAMATGKISHISLGEVGDTNNEAVGFCQRHQMFRVSAIPKHLYGRKETMQAALPEHPVSVVSVPSMIVCHQDLDDNIAYELTKAIYTHKHLLGSYSAPMQRMTEPQDLDTFVYPIHEGAKQYYQRRAPGFLVVYAEVIALLLSGTIALVGLASALRQWSAVKHKNRIDEYYKELMQSLKRLHTGNVDPRAEEKMLIDLRTKAYDELVSEKLYANESFRIFQDLLEQCLKEARRAIMN